ncbi:apses-domain-containing protein [Polychaeton citri CBS 116435]|uniref:Apses-domain-containing protein n=1 Tax=Polychaeton citri CBS 116435 TaxID=1314669 RepID=A0A9P4QCN3_9PEZI|nr:apses-domain-containing protein [Polychaeton citri CBS 116435]
MNQGQPYMDVSQSHAQQPGQPAPIAQYGSYGQPQALQPASHPYAPAYSSQYPPYSNTMPPMSAAQPVTSSMGQPLVPQSLPLPTMGGGAQPGSAGAQQYQHTFDTTGQIAPPGMKPRVTATLWEDEGSLCFQVEANGVCVARREDNHMINGTKLLNVAGMTRGRRDGILKSEKTRHVVKIGPMHLKGVWIPFDRALDFANKEKITEMLYPLFVHNIGALLYHPTNQARQSIGNAAMAARRPDSSDMMRTPQGTQPPALTHHHSMSNPMSAGAVSQTPHSIAPHPASGRPGIDRAHTFPTPPTSAGMHAGGYEYGGAQGHGTHDPTRSDTSLRDPSLTATATTPPGTSAQSMSYPSAQAYDSSRPAYSMPSSYSSQYNSQYTSQPRPYGQVQPSPSMDNKMAPPASVRPGAENEHPDGKPHDGYGHQDAEGEHEGEYTHTSASYDARRASYSYKPNPPPGPAQISPEMTQSPHPNGSGRATPRTTSTYPQYGSTPNRAETLPSSNLYNVMGGDTRAGAPNGAPAYTQPNGYAAYPPQPSLPPSNKRVRELDDQEDPYGRSLGDSGDMKRQRTDTGPIGAMGARPISQPHSVKAGR